MRILVLFVISILMMAPSCQDETSVALKRSQIARSWLKSQPDSITRWVLHSTFDPYQRGTYYLGDAGNPEVLELASSGVFHQYDSIQQSYGQWFMNPADSTLSFRYEIRNNKLISSSDHELSGRQQYRLTKMTGDSLILEVQGRHGMLVITYLPVEN